MIRECKLEVSFCDNSTKVPLWCCGLGCSAHGFLLASAYLEQTSPKPQHEGGPDANSLVLGCLGSLWRCKMDVIGSRRSRLSNVGAVITVSGKLNLLPTIIKPCRVFP